MCVLFSCKHMQWTENKKLKMTATFYYVLFLKFF